MDCLKQCDKASFCVMDKGFKKDGEWIIISPKTTSGNYSAGKFISIFGTDGVNSVWQSNDASAKGTFATRLKPEQIKVIVFSTNNSDYVMMDIN